MTPMNGPAWPSRLGDRHSAAAMTSVAAGIGARKVMLGQENYRWAIGASRNCVQMLTPTIAATVPQRQTRPARRDHSCRSHQGIKGRIRCMRGFKSHDAAARFCREHRELRNLPASSSSSQPTHFSLQPA
jgi:hypothetical protein